MFLCFRGGFGRFRGFGFGGLVGLLEMHIMW